MSTSIRKKNIDTYKKIFLRRIVGFHRRYSSCSLISFDHSTIPWIFCDRLILDRFAKKPKPFECTNKYEYVWLWKLWEWMLSVVCNCVGFSCVLVNYFNRVNVCIWILIDSLSNCYFDRLLSFIGLILKNVSMPNDVIDWINIKNHIRIVDGGGGRRLRTLSSSSNPFFMTKNEIIQSESFFTNESNALLASAALIELREKILRNVTEIWLSREW